MKFNIIFLKLWRVRHQVCLFRHLPKLSTIWNLIWIERRWLTFTMSSKKEESRSREKSNNNNHSTKPFSLQKSSNQWMIIKYRFLNSRKDFQLTWRLVFQMNKQKKDYWEMVQINSHKKKESIGLLSFFMSLQVLSPCYFGQVVFYVLSLMLCPHKIQVTCIWVLCCS